MSLMYGDSADVGPIEYYEYEGLLPRLGVRSDSRP